MLTSKTKIYGLLGYPVKHSLSPLIHNSAFTYLGIDACYLCFETLPEYIKEAIEGIRALKIEGVNLTIPHKERCLAYLDEIEPLAKEIGAVNTIVREGERLVGYNTDAQGFLRALQELNFDAKEKTIFLLGAGGAGKAVGITLAKAGAKCIFIVDKERKKAEELEERIKRLSPSTRVEVSSVEEKEKILNANLLVNATPLGMNPQDPLPVSPDSLSPSVWVFDLIYSPPETKLLHLARKRGIKAENGLGMLIHQAGLSFQLWTGKQAPLQVMRESINKK
ncbi:MAG: shikimate dehydrogenase [Candidatus Omnitrophota bacterium]|nr:MAG: shikimate dehydrogenase [Candidatus Omnitrophota bacterium]